MVKRLLLTAIAGLFFSNINAQITINASDFQPIFTVGAQFISHTDTVTTSINIGGKGDFGTLDFRSVQSNTSYLSISQNVAGSPYASDFPQAQFAFKNNQEYEGNTSESWAYYGVEGDTYMFYGTGTAGTVSGMSVVTKLKFDPSYQTYKFPITYNSTFSTTTTESTETSFKDYPIAPVTESSNLSMTQTIDGYGKMITPDGKTLSCLRIKEESTIESEYGSGTSTDYNFITKTGESVTISAKVGQLDNGIIQIDNISWAEGFGSSDVVERTSEMPISFSLSQNYPNPFNPTTNISFSLPKQSNVILKVYDVLGNEVAELAKGEYEAGVYNASFDASRLSSGIYFYTLRTDNFMESKKMMLVK